MTITKAFLEEWKSVSTAVRSAFIQGNYGWTPSFGDRYAKSTGAELTEQTFVGKGPFAIEPYPGPKPGDTHMLVFMPSGHVYEAKLVDFNGRVVLLWLAEEDYKMRPLITIGGVRQGNRRYTLANNNTNKPHKKPYKKYDRPVSEEMLPDSEASLVKEE